MPYASISPGRSRVWCVYFAHLLAQHLWKRVRCSCLGALHSPPPRIATHVAHLIVCATHSRFSFHSFFSLHFHAVAVVVSTHHSPGRALIFTAFLFAFILSRYIATVTAATAVAFTKWIQHDSLWYNVMQWLLLCVGCGEFPWALIACLYEHFSWFPFEDFAQKHANSLLNSEHMNFISMWTQ